VSLTAALLLSGCAVGPDYARPRLDLPDRWANAAKSEKPAPALSRWWEKLGDRLLNRLIDEAVAGNLDAAKAKAKIRSARATLAKTGGVLWPTMTGSVSAQPMRSTGMATGQVQSGAFEYNQFQPGLDASWELDIFGGNHRAVEAAERSAEAAEDDLYATLLSLIGDVASNYIIARGYQARIELAGRTVASQQQTAMLTKAKFAAGAASAIDVAKAEAIAISTEANIPAYRTSYAQAVHRIGILSGREPEALIEEMRKGGSIPIPIRRLPAGIPANVLTRRPDVRAAERLLAQSTALIGKAEAARYPSVSLAGSISSTATNVGDLGKSSTIGWAVGPTLTVPIFNGGQLAAAVDIAAAERDQSFIAFKASVLGALEDVENALVALTQQRIQTAKLEDAASRYRQAAKLSRDLYQTGSSSFLDLLDAERSLYSAEDSLLVSRITVATDYVALAKSLGGGWDKPVDSSAPEVTDEKTGPRLAAVRSGGED
jgi:NodT family efflux transporter outer membrane factor (OMF) lipoprotein